jgi:CRISPR-associated protein Csy3
MATKSSIKVASVLAFERKLDASDALFYSGNWETKNSSKDWVAITLNEKSVRGTISNRLKAKDAQDPTKLDAKVESPNLQTVDVASLPPSSDTLKTVFTLKVLGGAGTPSACNSEEFQRKVQVAVDGYTKEFGFKELAKRYATNIANGRFLWRNRVGAEDIEVVVNLITKGRAEKTWTFNALDFSVRTFDETGKSSAPLSELAAAIEVGLMGSGYTLLEIISFARIGRGQEVYPSQELILEKGEGKKSKTLYDVNGVAGMHSQKIANAIRTIDTWYSEDVSVGPIPIETYGAVTALGKAFRAPASKNDFYTLFDNWTVRDVVPNKEQQHFVIGVLIRGGVFGESDKDSK